MLKTNRTNALQTRQWGEVGENNAYTTASALAIKRFGSFTLIGNLPPRHSQQENAKKKNITLLTKKALSKNSTPRHFESVEQTVEYLKQQAEYLGEAWPKERVRVHATALPHVVTAPFLRCHLSVEKCKIYVRVAEGDLEAKAKLSDEFQNSSRIRIA